MHTSINGEKSKKLITGLRLVTFYPLGRRWCLALRFRVHACICVCIMCACAFLFLLE